MISTHATSAVDAAPVCYGELRWQNSQTTTSTGWHRQGGLKATNAVLPQRSPLLLRLARAVATLRGAFKIEAPVGYQDENGFHFGVQPAEKKINWPPAG